jgi:hypothetical protein
MRLIEWTSVSLYLAPLAPHHAGAVEALRQRDVLLVVLLVGLLHALPGGVTRLVTRGVSSTVFWLFTPGCQIGYKDHEEEEEEEEEEEDDEEE